MSVHLIRSSQPMMVERDWEPRDGGLQHTDSTISSEVGEEQFECDCGEEFDNREDAEAHIREVMPK